MRRSLLAVILLSALVTIAYSADDRSVGTLSGRHYENQQYGFSIDIPSGWQPAPAEAVEKVQPSVNDSGHMKLFLVVEPEAGGEVAGTMIAVEGEVVDGFSGASANVGKHYVESASRVPNLSVTREPFTILLGGLDFYRTDLRGTANGRDHFFALIATGRRGSIVVFNVHGDSQMAVDDAVGMLVGAVHFTPDWSVPDSQLDTSKYRIRVSMGVSEGMLKKKVQPTYPVDARRAHLQGYVVLGALISREGEVQRLWIADGDASLAAAAVDAVRQWRYKPYMLNGQPVIVETKIAVKFELR